MDISGILEIAKNCDVVNLIVLVIGGIWMYKNLNKKIEEQSKLLHDIDKRLAVIESHQGCYIKNQHQDKDAI